MDNENTGDTRLKELIFQKIDRNPNQAISFADFMELALYEPKLGYYSQPGRPIGTQGGDFYTSVSVGKCFGLLLGYALEAEWEQDGRPENWLMVEQGAHDGQLALDILEGLQHRNSPLLGNLSYQIIEPHAGRRDFLRERLAGNALIQLRSSVEPMQSIKHLANGGVFLCNELLDAFPVHRIRWENGQWQELWVERAQSESGFAYRPHKIDDPALLKEVAQIDATDFAEAYTTEINLAMQPWLESVAKLFANCKGHWWLIDYGHLHQDYYSRERQEGTLRCFQQHRASDDAFASIGESDITAHVNFSRLADLAMQMGLEVESLQDQHHFLTHAARTWFLEMETNASTQLPENKKLLRQFQTLTHPGMMGRAFKVLKLNSP